jgi:hypothetical protein
MGCSDLLTARPVGRDSQADSQADGRQWTIAHNCGSAISPIELKRTLVNILGCQTRGLQNRLGGPWTFDQVHLCPPASVLELVDSQ